ncbi:MAG: C-terminal target protein [Bacteroidetes bacterium]|nr:C-terminal target protein [Bacteroidota bacterium]
MKKLLLLCSFCFAFMATKAQNLNCGNFCILGITVDSTTHEMNVTIYNGDTLQVNYPVVQVVNATGDTVGNIDGQFYLFAQLAGDTVVHTIPTTINSAAGFTGLVYLSNGGDTTAACMFSYPMTCTVGIHELYAANRINVYPNPATDNITVDIEKLNNKEAVIAIYDMTGNMIRSYTTASNQLTINRDGLKSGMYFISVTADNKRYTNKLIIQ